MSLASQAIRIEFFDYLFEDDEGWICISTRKDFDQTTWRDRFFLWPNQRDKMGEYITKQLETKNVWFGVNLFSKAERKKQYCRPSRLVWADLDTCDPASVVPKPQCVIQSSPGRYQAIWRLDQAIDPYIAQEYSKKIAYTYKQNGADPSGWDLTQLLRVPFTFNFKYPNEGAVPEVALEHALKTLLPVVVFEDMPTPDMPADQDGSDTEEPTELPDVEKVIYKYWPALSKTPFLAIYENTPDIDDDWSRVLWKLINICVEAGMTAEEAYAIVKLSKCNKYERDRRPTRYLWREVLKAETQHNRVLELTGTLRPLTMPELVSAAEVKDLQPTIVDEYREWASEATDAVVAYHDLSAFMLLSALTANGLYCNVSYGKTVPNIWGLILGDSTLTRKSTAMRLAMDFIADIDRDVVLATDGSAEGLLTGLAGRPHLVSVFFKDEVSGFFDSINRKDYLAGMPETMTQLYDVPSFYTRRLRKETISITSPVFIFFGGGIKDKMYSLISEGYILSGFLPRFLIVSGETDLKKIKRTGPANTVGSAQREELRRQFHNLYNTYAKNTTILEVGGQQIIQQAEVEIVLTEAAWTKYGDLEEQLVHTAHESPISHLALPTFERLSRSLLKMALLLAAARQEPDEDNKITCELQDVLHAASYIQDWGRYSVDMLINSGRTIAQRVVDKILKAVETNPGITRSKLMQHHHLSKREMDEIQATLVDRQQLQTKAEGRTIKLWPI